MDIYHFHPTTGEYLGQSLADESPLEPGVFLVPAYATTTPAPADTAGFVRKFDGTAWGYVPVEAPNADPTPDPVLTPEQIRAAMPSLTMRQFRLGLLGAGLYEAVQNAVNSMSEPQRSAAKIEFDFASVVLRTNPLVTTLASALGLTDEQVDFLWMSSVDL